MNKWVRKLRKIAWVFHEALSPMGLVVWADHRIQELDEAINELKRMKEK